MADKNKGSFNIKNILANNAVPIIFIGLSVIAIPISGFSANYLIQEMLTRLARNSFLVLSLLIPILAGMGLNFGMVLGAMAGQIGLIFVTDWAVTGVYGMMLAGLIGTPIAIVLGYICGAVLNRAKGREMVTSYILGFFINGVYQLIVLYTMGRLIPISNPQLVLSRGYGIRNAINLTGVRHVLDNLIPVSISGIDIPLATFILIRCSLHMRIQPSRRTYIGRQSAACRCSVPLII